MIDFPKVIYLDEAALADCVTEADMAEAQAETGLDPTRLIETGELQRYVRADVGDEMVSRLRAERDQLRSKAKALESNGARDFERGGLSDRADGIERALEIIAQMEQTSQEPS